VSKIVLIGIRSAVCGLQRSVARSVWQGTLNRGPMVDMTSTRGLVLALVVACVCGTSVTNGDRSQSLTRQLRAAQNIAQEHVQVSHEVGADTASAGYMQFADSAQIFVNQWASQASDILSSVPVPLAVKQVFGFLSGADLRAEQDTEGDSSRQQILWTLIYVLIYLLWILLFVGLFVGLFAAIGYFYTTQKHYPDVEESLATPEQQASFRDWKFGFCSCFGNLEVCCCAWCCPCIRWGENLSLVNGLIIFWVGFGIYFSFMVLGSVTSGYLCWMLLTLICTAYRQELRMRFQMDKVGGMTYITDCLLYGFCACCAMSQEARHIEEALKYGHKAVRVPERE